MMPEQMALCFEPPSRRAKGEVFNLLLTVIGEDWLDIRDIVKKTGLTRNHLHRALARSEFDVMHNGLGRGHAVLVRRRLTVSRLDQLMKPTSLKL